MQRRQFLAGSLAGISYLSANRLRANNHVIRGNAFSLGIASGDVTEDSAILWTRIAPEPLAQGGGIDPVDLPVTWELSSDRNMRKIVQRGQQMAIPELAHAIHVDVQGLAPGQDYWYRFSAGGQSSMIGHTRTLKTGAHPDLTTRFVTTSCQNYTHGYFTAFEHMVRDEPDFVIHLGDYIYDTSFGETFRQHDSEQAPETLTDFRNRHALYKTDPQLQFAHANLPFYTVIDNHDALQDNDPTQYAKRAAAYQAWYEHMPVRGFNRRSPNQFTMHRQVRVGDLMQISLLDTRQFRDSKYLCNDNLDKAMGFGNYRERCDDLLVNQRSMLGEAQERWLYDAINNNTAHWNVIASSGPVLPFRLDQGGAESDAYGYIGAWDAYPANRQRLAKAIESAATGHPLILSGDLHSFWAMDGNRISNPEDRVAAVEFVTSSISANWPEPLSKPIRDNLSFNPHVDFYNGGERGYLLHDVAREAWQTRFRAVGDARRRDAPIRDLQTFTVAHGEPGLTRTTL